MKKIIVVGGGAAGMIAAIAAAQAGCEVLLLEKNEKLGKKLFITGKGRCNVTTACDAEEFFQGVTKNPKFLYSSFYRFSNQDVMDALEEWGLTLKVERGNRVFPASDKSSDVIRVFQKKLQQLGVTICLHTEVKNLLCEEEKCIGVVLKNGQKQYADGVIVATGGVSYPVTGSTGDGHRFAKDLGLAVSELYPSLVPFCLKDDWYKDLQGLALKNVNLTLYNGKKKLYSGFGEMLFTHFGISGPLVLTASTVLSGRKETEFAGELDLKPALTMEQLDKRVQKDFEEACKKQFKNSLNQLFPSRMVPVMIELSGIDPEKRVNEISKAEREQFCHLIKHVPFTVVGLRGFADAIITRGGVSVKEINPSTMESKKVQNLYFAGEVLDLDAITGGYNLQIAWSTGYAAGVSAGEDEKYGI